MKNKFMRIVTLICVVALIFVMAVPAFATAVDGPYFYIDHPSYNEDFDIVDVATGTSFRGKWLSFNTVYKVSASQYVVVMNGDAYISVGATSVDSPYCFDVSDIGTSVSAISSFIKDSSSAGKTFYFVVERDCDNSTCSAADLNNDNICDDCGGKLPMSVSYIDKDNTYPYPSHYVMNYQGDFEFVCIVYDSSEGYYYFHCSPTAFQYDPGTGLLSNNGSPVHRYRATITSDSEAWTYVGEYDTFSWTLNDTNTFVTANNYIFGTDGTIFFRPTPIQMEAVTQEMMSGAMTEVLAILPVGLVCLIGYLALRKALRVLEKVLYQA